MWVSYKRKTKATLLLFRSFTTQSDSLLPLAEQVRSVGLEGSSPARSRYALMVLEATAVAAVVEAALEAESTVDVVVEEAAAVGKAAVDTEVGVVDVVWVAERMILGLRAEGQKAQSMIADAREVRQDSAVEEERIVEVVGRIVVDVVAEEC